MIQVFVYGTLMSGERNHQILQQCGSARLLRETAIPSTIWKMVSCGPFPAVIKSESPTIIRGELWEIDSISLLDQLEGYPRLYSRRRVAVGDKMAWMYFMKEPSPTYPTIWDGNWKKREKSQKTHLRYETFDV
jgi:gamma-glutamylcyclotransferase (GGCT)/AIG2-like uncharacterized protein YtfP